MLTNILKNRGPEHILLMGPRKTWQSVDTVSKTVQKTAYY